MLPHDLSPKRLDLPPGPRDSAVLFSGGQLRHLRLGYLLQQRFPGLLKAWYVAEPSRKTRLASKVDKARELLQSSASVATLRERLAERDLEGLWDMAELLRRRAGSFDMRRAVRAVMTYATAPSYGAAEQRMFGKQVELMRANAMLHPTVVPTPNEESIMAAVEKMQPYFIVAFGGPLLRGRLLASARGVALNQHAGWSPELRGASTIETALYHRQLGWVGNTVHVMDTFADSGAILRRSSAALHPDDGIAECFVASVALGTKMMLECIDNAIREGAVTVFPQPPGGQTVNIIDYGPAKRSAVARDLAQRWVADALRIAREY